MIVPIIKKRKRKVVEDYRGITLMATDYKMYMAMLEERIRKDSERRKGNSAQSDRI